MFATEPVTASLAGLLQEKDDQERTGGVQGRTSRYILDESGGQKTRRELEIDELEIQKGLLQIAQGLEFLHESASLVHGNLTPDAIYINIKVSGTRNFYRGARKVLPMSCRLSTSASITHGIIRSLLTLYNPSPTGK